MLSTLRIRNLALVAELTLEFPAGLVVVTGETGAGKSVVLGALNLLLGQRADRSLIRSGADACTVEAVFDVRALPPAFHEALAEHGLEPCEDNQLFLKRAFTAAGANRQFVNGSPVTLARLAAIGDWLVDMHGPHDHQSLLHPARQLALLDAYGRLGSEVEAFGALIRERAAVEAEKAALVVDEHTYAQQLDLLRFQVHEIEDAQLDPAEVAALEAEHQRASNAVRLLELAQTLLHGLTGDEAAVLNRLGDLGRLLHELRQLDPDTEPLAALHEQALALLHELRTGLADYAERLDFDPARLEELEQRINLLQNLRRKYGDRIEDILAFGAEARRKLEQLESRETELARLDEALARLDRKIADAGRRLSQQRRRLVPRLVRAVSRELAQLGFAQSRFDLALETLDRPGAAGFDQVEFLFAPNPGEPPRPLRAIASSGEMARVMLAIKTVLAAEDEIPVLVFDEVDANVGGETARVVGEKMREIAAHRQVFCITHLAPVAAAAGAHFLVRKEIRDGRTFTRMEPLTGDDRIAELARMLGGRGEAARRHAAELLATAAPRKRRRAKSGR